MEAEIVAAIIVGGTTLSVAIVKGWDYVGGRRNGSSIAKLYTRVAVVEKDMENHSNSSPELNKKIEKIESDITKIREDVARIKGLLERD